MSKRRKWWPVWLIVIGAVAGVVPFFPARTKAVQPKRETVPLAKVSYSNVQIEITATGSVKPATEVEIKTALSGKVTTIAVIEGDFVRKGELLAVIEPDVNQSQTLAAVRRDVNREEINFSDAEKEYVLKHQLVTDGLISAEEFRSVETRYKAAKESLATAREKATIMESSGIPISTNPNQRLNIVSPLDGVVIKRSVQLGEEVTGAGAFNAGTVIATVADLSKMIIAAEINEVDIGKVRTGANVTVSVDAFPKLRFSGKVVRIAPAARVRDQMKIFDVEIDLSSRSQELRPGMTANVLISGDRASHVLTIPVEAIFRSADGGDVVYVKRIEPGPTSGATANPISQNQPDWEKRFEERRVESGLASLSEVEIVKGLKIDEEVALEDPTRSQKDKP